MKKFILKIFFIILLMATVQRCDAQMITRDVVSTGTQTVSTGQISIAYVLGEAVGGLLENAANNSIFTTGFVQPDSDMQILLNSNLSTLIAFPNPSAGPFIKLGFNHVPDGVYRVTILNALGQVMQSQIVAFKVNNFYYLNLDVSRLPGGNYFISITNSINFTGQAKFLKL